MKREEKPIPYAVFSEAGMNNFPKNILELLFGPDPNDPRIGEKTVILKPSDEGVDEFMRYYKRTPTDVIDLTSDSLRKSLGELWGCSDIESPIAIPSDIVFQDTIPVRDLKMVIKFDVSDLEDFNDSDKYRVIVFDNSKEIALTASNRSDSTDDMNNIHIIGEVVIQYNAVDTFTIITNKIETFELIIPFGICPNELNHLYVLTNYVVLVGDKEDAYFPREQIKNDAMLVLAYWYSCQLAMLHPTIKEVFRNPRIINDKKKHSKGKKKRIKHVRLHVINPEDIKKAMNVKTGKSKRHTMLWHVAGFYRTSKTGKKHFVQGHWRGPLRFLKSTDTPRERELIVGDEKETT